MKIRGVRAIDAYHSGIIRGGDGLGHGTLKGTSRFKITSAPSLNKKSRPKDKKTCQLYPPRFKPSAKLPAWNLDKIRVIGRPLRN